MYDNFNSNLIRVQSGGSGADKTFFNKLKSSGYGAVYDINDMKYSGYNTKKPLIVFDNSKGNILVKKTRDITSSVDTRNKIEHGKMAAEEFVKMSGPLSAATLTTATVRTYRSDPNDEYDHGGNSKWS